MQAAVAVAEGGVAAVMRGLYMVMMTVLGLLVRVVLQVQVSVELVAEAAVLVVVMVRASVKAWLGMEGGSGDHR